MKWKKRIAVALLALTIASPVEAQQQRMPVTCTRIVSSGPVHNGMYTGINCREGHYLTVGRRDGVMPSRGPARVSDGVIVDRTGRNWTVLP
jgi:hypothetical protein